MKAERKIGRTEGKSAGKPSSIKIGLRAFIGAAAIIFVLMMISGAMTRVLPSGKYQREVVEGRSMVVPGSFSYVEAPDYPFWRWFTAPAEVLVGNDKATVITLCLFIVFMSGSFTILEEAGLIGFILSSLVRRFRERKYLLMGIVIFLFMFMAAFLGVYEGLVPLIVFIIPLAYSLGWDSLTGLGMSLLPLAFGFSAAVSNPFTIAVAQRIAELPLFSGAWLRLIFFCLVYIVVYWFVSRHARRIEAEPERSLVYTEDLPLRQKADFETAAGQEKSSARMTRGLIWFAACLFAALGFVVVSARIPSVSYLAFPLMGLLFFAGGIGGGLLSGMGGGAVARTFGKGTLNILPGIVLVLMAYSVYHIIEQAKITDTILFMASSRIAGAPPVLAGFLIYLLTLFMNFFIGSASAKAFLMMPILTPLADLVGITRQTAILAFDFGDGFSNMVYPSNALLLIALGFTVVSYPKWIRWTWKLQLFMLGLTSLFIYIAVKIGFGPF